MDERRHLDLPGEAVTLLSNPPVGETALLELAAEWPELDPALAEIAESVRLFALTWDPLDWLPGRADYFHARNVADDRGDAELVIYFTVGGLQRMLDTGRHGSTVASVLGGVATELIAAAAESPAPKALPTIGLASPAGNRSGSAPSLTSRSTPSVPSTSTVLLSRCRARRNTTTHARPAEDNSSDSSPT